MCNKQSKQYNGVWGKLYHVLVDYFIEQHVGMPDVGFIRCLWSCTEQYTVSAMASSNVQPSKMAHSDVGTELGTPDNLFPLAGR